jgi:RHS repeat-associated protein
MKIKKSLILNPNPTNMKKLILLFAVLFGFIGAKAQNPFAELGYEPKIATLSQGQFNESFDNDTIVQIGSVLFNTKSKQIVAFVQTDTMYSEATLQPDIVSRWISPDPLADHPTQIGLTPYHYAGNNPIYWTDPDGRCPWCLVWAAVEIGLAVYDAYETGATIIDPNASTGEKWAAAGGFALGAIMPGGGYGAGAKQVTKAAITNTTEKAVKETSKEAMQRGVKNEAKTIAEEGLTKNTKTFTAIDPVTKQPVNVKPDALDAKKLSEIKDTKTVSNTKQIRTEREVAKQQGKEFEIITGTNTKVSKNIPANEVKKVDYLGPQKKQ